MHGQNFAQEMGGVALQFCNSQFSCQFSTFLLTLAGQRNSTKSFEDNRSWQYNKKQKTYLKQDKMNYHYSHQYGFINTVILNLIWIKLKNAIKISWKEFIFGGIYYQRRQMEGCYKFTL